MKKFYVLFVIIALPFSLCAQQMERQVISSSGDEGSDGNLVFSWTLGELATETLKSGSIILTQGFQQANVSVSAIDDQLLPESMVKIYPNPVSDKLHFTINEPNFVSFEMTITDMKGRTMRQKTYYSPDKSIDLSFLKPAVYLLKIKCGEKYGVYKLIRE